MFGRLSKLFRKGSESGRQAAVQPPVVPEPPKDTAPEPLPVITSPEERESTDPISPAAGEAIKIPLNAIVKQVPKELFKRGAGAGAVRGYYFLPCDQALEQLSSGAVKISFGELCKVAPKGLFVESTDKQQELVSLPLREILRRLKPEHYDRRKDQVRVEVPETVREIFGPKGEPLNEMRILKKEELRSQGDTNPGLKKISSGVSRGDTEPAISFAGPFPKAAPAAPSSREAPPPPIHVPDALKEIMAKNAAARAAGAPALPGAPASPRPVKPLSPYSIPGSASPSAFPPKPASAAPVPPQPPVAPPVSLSQPQAAPLPSAQPAPAPVPTSAPQFVSIAVAELSADWPDPVREELACLQLDSAQCKIPYQELAKGMRQGRVAFRWNQVRCWLQPEPPADFAISDGEAILEIPLNRVMSYFLQNRPASTRHAATGGSGVPSENEIPDVFFSETPPAPKPAPTASAPAQAAPPADTTTMDSIPDPFAVPNVSGVPAPSPAAPHPSAPAAPVAPAAPSASVKGDVFEIELETVSADWPVPVLSKLEQQGLSGAHLAIPKRIVEEDLKRGKIEHNWLEICRWIKGHPGLSENSDHAALRLTMPLHVIAPLFFAHRNASADRKSFVPNNIPDVFSSESSAAAAPAPAPVAPAAPAPAAPAPPVETPVAPVPQAVAPVAPPAESPQPAKAIPKNIAELFGEPAKKNWTPNEIVNKTTQLEGVDGALIALQDGLLVASCMPPEWKTETVAAFMPQMFGRMDQYTRELSVGDLKSLALTVEQGTLIIFNAGLTYFAAMAKGGKSIPIQELTLIANELSRHTK